MPPRPPKFVPPIGFLLSITAMWLLNRYWPIERWPPRPWNLLGVILLLGGIVLSASGARRFFKHKTNVRPLTPSSALVTDGPFRFTRNPMYLGLIVALIGIVMLFGSVSPILVVPVFAVWITLRFIRAEEAYMTEQFGDAYLAYAKRVRRWL